MPYQPAVTPNFAPIGDGIRAAGNSIADGMDSVRKEREKNEAADVTLEHLHSASPELLEPFLRRTGDTQTPSAELLSSFLGKSTRSKKEALIGAAAADALMRQRKLSQGLETVQVGNEGMRIAQQANQNVVQNQQWNAEQQRLKTKAAMDYAERNKDRKTQGKVDIVDLPNGAGTMVVNGSGNFSVQKPAQPATVPAPPWAVQAMAADPNLYWTGDALRAKPAAPPTFGPVPGAVPGTAAPGSPPLPPLPKMYRTPNDVKNDSSLTREQKAQILRAEFGLR